MVEDNDFLDCERGDFLKVDPVEDSDIDAWLLFADVDVDDPTAVAQRASEWLVLTDGS